METIMATTLICGLLGIAGLVIFMGFMLWWVKALPLIIITLGVACLLLYDYVQTLRFGEDHGSR
jgi:hypothetical protein